VLMTGGRFDNLISHFIPHGTKKDLYAIGLRIDGLALLKAKIDYEAQRQIENIGDVDREVYIISNETMFKEKLILGNKLWTRGYKVILFFFFQKKRSTSMSRPF
jgi:histidyl-tRNA synthetase